MSEETKRETKQERSLSRPVLVLGLVVLAIVIIALARFCSSAATIHVTVNGNPLTVHGAKTMETAVRESGLPINPGDLISLQGNVIKRNAGYPFYATVNGEETFDPEFVLSEGAEIQITDGHDKVEDYDAVEEPREHSATVRGSGSLCSFIPGRDGIKEHRTGRISGETVDRVTVKPISAECNWYNVNVGDDKVIALTFDQGPSEDYTTQILDILAVNDARATFFCVGEEVEKHPDIVRREWSAYHQVCTNTYDREWTTHGTSEQLVEEIEQGVQAISDALDGEEVSRVVRFPDFEVTEDMAAAIDRNVTTAVGWDLNTGDWLSPSESSIYDVLMSAKPGDIVLLTDGGGDRSNTVEALRKAIPELKQQGYSFITIDELMRYPTDSGE